MRHSLSHHPPQWQSRDGSTDTCDFFSPPARRKILLHACPHLSNAQRVSGAVPTSVGRCCIASGKVSVGRVATPLPMCMRVSTEYREIVTPLLRPGQRRVGYRRSTANAVSHGLYFL